MERYYSIYAFMVDMGLKGAQLQVFALIFSFCRSGGKMMMKQDDIAKRVGYSVRAVKYALQELCKSKLIEKSTSPARTDCLEFVVSEDIKNKFLDDKRNQNLNEESSEQQRKNCTTEVQNLPLDNSEITSGECKNCTTEVQKLPLESAKTAPEECKNCTTEVQKLPTYNKPYIKVNSNLNNNFNNTLSPNGDSESDIVESELSIDDLNSDVDDNTVKDVNTIEDEKGSGTGNADKADKAKKAKTKSKKAQDTEINARFEKFWAAYPRHIDKAKALKAFTKINPGDELLEQMLKSINEAKKTRQWETPQYIPYPTTWLNGSRWEDEIDSDNPYDDDDDENYDPFECPFSF